MTAPTGVSLPSGRAGLIARDGQGELWLTDQNTFSGLKAFTVLLDSKEKLINVSINHGSSQLLVHITRRLSQSNFYDKR